MSETQRQVVATEGAPKAIGPYSQGIRYGGLVFSAGQIPLDPATGNMVAGGIEAQTRQALENVKGVLAAAGASLDSVLKTTVFMVDLADFSKMNTVYAEFFTQNPPARSAVQVAALPRGSLVEIECVAAVNS
jgi:2-iminobutanoate/2-iminopropanoate deaminase